MPSHNHTFSGNSMWSHSHWINDPGHTHNMYTYSFLNVANNPGFAAMDAGTRGSNGPFTNTSVVCGSNVSNIWINNSSAGVPSGSISYTGWGSA